jgi:hypothetical protein
VTFEDHCIIVLCVSLSVQQAKFFMTVQRGLISILYIDDVCATETTLAIGSKEQNGMLNQSGRLWVEGHFSGAVN